MTRSQPGTPSRVHGESRPTWRSRRSGCSNASRAQCIPRSTASASTAAAATSTRASSPTTTSTGRRSEGTRGQFVDLMTSRTRDAADELLESAATHLKAGEWPWSFYCYPEGRPRPVFPSSFVAVAPGERWLGLAVRCPACEALSVNLVTHAHVDLPFANDARVGVVDHVFADGRAQLDRGIPRGAPFLALRRAPPAPELAGDPPRSVSAATGNEPWQTTVKRRQ